MSKQTEFEKWYSLNPDGDANPDWSADKQENFRSWVSKQEEQFHEDKKRQEVNSKRRVKKFLNANK